MGYGEPPEDTDKAKRLPVKSGQHASPCLDFYEKISDTYQLIRQQLAEVWCTAGKVGGEQIAIKSLGRDHGGVIAVVVIAVLVAR